ncbi:hypothetical protein [Maritalea mediterranea]|uniref:DUF2189 domain-containing protein n=1 Tax=Maritalea mediterranea TaxID=2909667 RepID=A0ABS9EAI4_9HYPH|nr:hypothetical protein [Maritalea mediterranea]MCF4099878.1 hypothetical protein [Maritalea mediterranea]
MYNYPKYEKRSRDHKFLSAIGYVGFIERLADSQLAEGLQKPWARRVTSIAFILGATGIGMATGAIVYAADKGWSMWPFFMVIPLAVFVAWLAEVAMVIQINRAMFKHFDERMEQVYLDARASAHGLAVIIMALVLLSAPMIFVTIQELDLAFAIYVSIALPAWVVVATGPHIVLSWTLGAATDPNFEDDQ